MSSSLPITDSPPAKKQQKGKRTMLAPRTPAQNIQVEFLDPALILPNEYNPNRQSDHEFGLLLKSIEEDGFTQPLIINQDNIVVDGEHRWRAAQTLHLAQVPVIRVQMTREQMRIATLRHNRARGLHNINLEADILNDLATMGMVAELQDALLLEDVEITRLINDFAGKTEAARNDYNDLYIPNTVDTATAAMARQLPESVRALTEKQASGQSIDGALQQQAMTDLRTREEALAIVKRAQDTERAWQEAKNFVLVLVYSGEDATIVKAVLGKDMTRRILEICTAIARGEIPQ